MNRLCLVAVGSLVVGCAGDDIVLDGTHYQYVVSELRIPANHMMARENGLDLDGNGAVDNQLGMVFATLSTTGLGVETTATEALLRGGLIMLADLETTDFEHAEIAGFTTYLGGDPVPAPCLDPAELETCGQHLGGEGAFAIAEGSASGHAIAPIIDGVFLDPIGRLPVQLALDPVTPIRLDLRAARVRLSRISADHVSAILAGGVTIADIDGVVIPEAAAQMNRILGAECTQPATNPPCGCVDRGDLLQDELDADDDCEITVDELANSTIVDALLSPDIEIDGEALVSFGVGVELTTATFEAPAP